MVRFSDLHTPGGYQCGEVASALQKSIRRGKEREALFWASELDLAGYANYVWKRLRIIASEDVGVAEQHVALTVRALYENWLEAKKVKDDRHAEDAMRLFLVHAVLVLVRAKKSRICDHALMVVYYGERKPVKMPDYALDKHTAAGARKGRSWDHFFEVGTQLANRAKLVDPYEQEGREAMSSKPKRRRRVGFGDQGRLV
jgi:replication-associated recombination protein RarA